MPTCSIDRCYFSIVSVRGRCQRLLVLLLLELGVLGCHIGPRDLEIGQLTHKLSDLVHWHAHLLHGVTLSQCHSRWLFERVKVNGDGVGNGDLVRSSVVSANGAGAVVDLVRNTSVGQQTSCDAFEEEKQFKRSS